MAIPVIENFRRFVRNSIQALDKMAARGEMADDKSKGRAIQFFFNILRSAKASIETPLDIFINRQSAGYFYLFMYHSKLYEEGRLNPDFYDAYPLIFIFRVTSTHFWGINLHWLTARQRHNVMKMLILGYPEQFFSDKPLIPINWKVLLGKIKNKNYIKNAVKCYRKDHVIRLRGLLYTRIKNQDIVESMKYISPLWINAIQSEVSTYLRKHNI